MKSAKRRLWLHGRSLTGEFIEGMTRGNELERSRLRKVPRRRHRAGEVEPQDRVAELRGTPGRASEDPPIDHDPAPHAGADCDHHQVARDHPQLIVVGLG